MFDIVLFGIQGSGKSTISKQIIQEYPKYSHYEMGNILRTLKSTNNVLGNYVKGIIDSGGVVHYSFINSLFDAYMITLKHDELMLLDGFPRTISQLYTFLDRMQRSKRDFIVIFLDLSTDIAIQRISYRKYCKMCGSIFSLDKYDLTNCDKCNGELIHRIDDQPEAILKRLKLFFEETKPVIEYFDKIGALKVVNANQTPEKIFNEIKNFLNIKNGIIFKIENSILKK